jgi:outer membrane protein assembly factor BamB
MNIVSFVLAGLFWCGLPPAATGQPQPAPHDLPPAPRVVWHVAFGAPLFSSPVLSGSLLYCGGLDSILHAIDATTGKEVWHFRTGGEIRSTVCISGELLYLNGGDGMVYTMKKRDGGLLWKVNIGEERKNDFADYFQSSPVVRDGVLYVGSGDGRFSAIDANTSRVLWTSTTGGSVHSTPAIDHGKVFFGSFDGSVYALNGADGGQVWKFKTVGHRYFPRGEVQGSPAVFGNLVFVGARDYNVYAIDQEKGFCHWNKAFGRGWGLSMSVDDSILYIGTSDERVLIAADPETGRELWNDKMELLVFGNCAFSDSTLCVGTTIGRLHGIDIRTGRTIWSFATDAYRKNHSQYFKDDDTYRDDIYTIIKSNEQFLAVECELGGMFSTPVVTPDRIFLTCADGSVYCLGRE